MSQALVIYGKATAMVAASMLKEYDPLRYISQLWILECCVEFHNREFRICFARDSLDFSRRFMTLKADGIPFYIMRENKRRLTETQGTLWRLLTDERTPLKKWKILLDLPWEEPGSTRVVYAKYNESQEEPIELDLFITVTRPQTRQPVYLEPLILPLL